MTHNHTPTLIGLGGHKTHGKDAAADFLVSDHGFTKIGMSDVLAAALYELNPIIEVTPDEQYAIGYFKENPRDNVYIRYRVLHDAIGYTEVKRIRDVRELPQRLGTEVGRNLISEDVWVNATAKKIDALLAAGKSVALTGVRFTNELLVIRKRGGLLVWVNRPNGPVPDTSHSSEASLAAAQFDTVLQNDSDLPALRSSATQLLSDIRALVA
ncbi:MAG TPA: hypothetical protein VFU07_05415 [Candidatus Lumbricidophila sp.]|nr:hypothetical protein [Candidatus Lumbricidophila sp.]